MQENKKDFTLAEGATHVGNSNNKRRFAFTLAEGATHVGNSNNKRRFAFTLAEVLVTLGIIGVVAVLTVPNVISSYQKKVYVTQLQKGYSQLQQVFDLAMADDEVNDIRDTTLWSTIPSGGWFANGDSLDPFITQLKKYLKISKYCYPTTDPMNDSCFGINYTNLAGEKNFNKFERLKIYTPSGAVYYFNHLYDSIYIDDKPINIFLGDIEIDVNGDKKPNRIGRDLFSLALAYDGQLIFPGSAMWEDLGLSKWSETVGVNGCLPGASGEDMYMLGNYCGGRIFDNGWVMDY